MIIDCGNRRIASYGANWKLEILHTKKTGEQVWSEDRPAYPATLSQACRMVLERILIDGGDCSIVELPARLEAAYQAIEDYILEAGKLEGMAT